MDINLSATAHTELRSLSKYVRVIYYLVVFSVHNSVKYRLSMIQTCLTGQNIIGNKQRPHSDIIDPRGEGFCINDGHDL